MIRDPMPDPSPLARLALVERAYDGAIPRSALEWAWYGAAAAAMALAADRACLAGRRARLLAVLSRAAVEDAPARGGLLADALALTRALHQGRGTPS